MFSVKKNLKPHDGVDEIAWSCKEANFKSLEFRQTISFSASK